MKLCWFDLNRLGVVAEGQVFDVSEALASLPVPTYPSPPGDLLVANLDVVRGAVERLLPNARAIPLERVVLQSPVAQPSKIIGVPVNYSEHVKEAQADVATFTNRYAGPIREQGLFLKANTSLVGCGSPVRLRFPDRMTHHEIELAVVIGKVASNVSRHEALAYIAGYAVALDMTVRGPEDRSMRKSIDTYSVLGPWMVTADEVDDPQALALALQVNGMPRQTSNTALMIMNIAEQIEWASSYYTLYSGDILMTGTCEGVGRVDAGDVMDAAIEGVGAMRVAVEAASVA